MSKRRVRQLLKDYREKLDKQFGLYPEGKLRPISKYERRVIKKDHLRGYSYS